MGYKPGMSVDEPVAILKQCISLSVLWRLPSIWSTLDVLTAFDEVRMWTVPETLRSRGVDPLCIHALLKDIEMS